jgi:2-iminobutanoate/2-iminopropanoate deaminase
MTRRTINPESMRTPRLNSHGVLATGTPLYICGQIGRNAANELAGDGGLEAQVEQIFENFRAICEAAGGGIADIVKLTAFVTDPAAFAAITAARDRSFEPGGYPATTYIVVAALAAPDCAVEIEAIAAIG